MKIVKKRVAALALVAIVLVWAMVSLFNVTPAPYVRAAVITPVVNSARDGTRLVTFMAHKVLTADSRVCFDLGDMELLDLQYQAQVSTSNATTVKLQETNIDPTSGPFNDGPVLATIPLTPVDANTMTQAATFGRWNCVFADLTNSNPVTLTVIAIAK